MYVTSRPIPQQQNARSSQSKNKRRKGYHCVMLAVFDPPSSSLYPEKTPMIYQVDSSALFMSVRRQDRWERSF